MLLRASVAFTLSRAIEMPKALRWPELRPCMFLIPIANDRDAFEELYRYHWHRLGRDECCYLYSSLWSRSGIALV